MRFLECPDTCGWHQGTQGTGNEKVGTKPNLVRVLVPSFPLSVARYPLHLPHCCSIWSDNQQQTLPYPYSCVNYEPLLHTLLN